jgi:hypothetical protein
MIMAFVSLDPELGWCPESHPFRCSKKNNKHYYCVNEPNECDNTHETLSTISDLPKEDPNKWAIRQNIPLDESQKGPYWKFFEPEKGMFAKAGEAVVSAPGKLFGTVKGWMPQWGTRENPIEIPSESEEFSSEEPLYPTSSSSEEF